MPSVITHAVVGITAGSIFANKKMPLSFRVYSVFCSALPDADVIAFGFGIPYGHFFGHRGFFHSLFFALLLSFAAVSVFYASNRKFPRQWLRIWTCFFVICASHGILDAFTNGGLGIALLSPFDSTRYFFPWTPIKVSPIGIRAFFSMWGFRVLANEILWIWVPCLAIVLLAWGVRKLAIFRIKRRNKTSVNRSFHIY